jgi:hypothetical protein
MAKKITLKTPYISPVFMFRELEEGRLDPSRLTPDQRRQCLMVASNGSRTTAQLADLFNVTRPVIKEDLKILRSEVGREVVNWTKEDIVGHIITTAENISTAAMQRNDLGLAWTVERDMVKMLSNLGLFEDKEKSDSIRVTIEAVGSGYERASNIIANSLDPLMTGEVIEADAKVSDPTLGIDMMTLPPDATVRVETKINEED